MLFLRFCECARVALATFLSRLVFAFFFSPLPTLSSFPAYFCCVSPSLTAVSFLSFFSRAHSFMPDRCFWLVFASESSSAVHFVAPTLFHDERVVIHLHNSLFALLSLHVDICHYSPRETPVSRLWCIGHACLKCLVC